MYKIFKIKLVILLQVLVKVLAENKTIIEALEKEKGKLFNQINKAIEESVTVLKNSNDSEAVLGVNYMEKLKDQLKEINDADIKDPEVPVAVNDARRSQKLKLSMFELANVFQKNKKTKSKLERQSNKIVIKKKIDNWLLQRELEKQKIREYKEKQRKNIIKTEDCPRYGVGSKKSKIIRRSNDVDDNKEKNHKVKKTLPKYPCCRKCCKKSYMGCL